MYEPGFTINNSGDTLRGQCSLPNTITVIEINFKNSSGDISIYHPSEIKGFGYNTGAYFESIVERNEFMEVLSNGRVKLLRSGTQFFGYKEGKLYELISTEKQIEKNGQPYLLTTREYVGTLKLLLAECPKIQSKIDQAELRRASLVRLFESYNKCMGDVSTATKRMRQPSMIGFGASVYYTSGNLSQFVTDTPLGLSNISTPGNHVEYLTDMVKLNDINKFNIWSFGLAFSFMNPRVSKHFSFSLEALYNEINLSSSNVYYSFSTFLKTNYTSFKFTSTRFHLLGQYNFFQANKKVNPFINGGIGLDLYSTKPGTISLVNYNLNGTDYTDQTIVYPIKAVGFGYNVVLGAGVKINYTDRLQGQFTFRYETGPGPFRFEAPFGGSIGNSHQDLFFLGTSVFFMSRSLSK